jgi:pimeloyl-ACP methyl ester carboxylesterase
VKVTSQDGTVIGVSRVGSGPAVVLVDGALCHRGFGPLPALAAALAPGFTVFTYDRRGRGESGDGRPYAVEREIEDLDAVIRQAGGAASVCGVSSGAALALEAAARGLPIRKLALYEAPFIVDDTRQPLTTADSTKMDALVAAGEHGKAVAYFMHLVGVPWFGVLMMRLMPVWSKLKAAAPTLPHDLALTTPHQGGRPLPPTAWAAVTAPTLVIAGGKSPAWMQNAQAALAGVVPGARLETLAGQTHMVKAKVVAPVLEAFFRGPATG